MTETTKPKSSTAVATRPPVDPDAAVAQLLEGAKTPQDRERAYALADALSQSRLARKTSQLIAQMEWGASWSEPKRIAFGKYCLALGADPLRHVDLLGGNPFINGDYYRDVIAANPNFDHADNPLWIHADPRLLLCVGCGKAFGADPAHAHGMEEVTEENRWRVSEQVKRARLRVEHNADEKSPGICVLTLHYRDGRGPFIGIGEVHSGMTVNNKDRDPIGLASPRATAETRAWREAGEKAEATWFRTHASTLDGLAQRLKDAHGSEKLGAIPERLATGMQEEPIEVDAIPVEAREVAVESAATEAERDDSRMVRHNPSAICPAEGDHPAVDCKLEKKT